MTGALLIIIVAFIFGAGIVSYLFALYNGLVQAKNNTAKAFNNIDVLLQQRHEELPKLVSAARGYMKHERDLLTNIVNLRMTYRNAGNMAAKIDAENRLTDLMGRFNLLVEQYPDLKAVDTFNHLQSRISTIEGQIADRRELFNDSVNIYNIRIEQLPELLLARILNYAKREYLKVPEEKKQDIALDLPN